MSYAHTFLHDLDCDRLYDATACPYTSRRGNGKTMAYIARMSIEGIIGDGSHHVYIGESQQQCRYIAGEVYRIFTHYGLVVHPDICRNQLIIVSQEGRHRIFEFRSIRSLEYDSFYGANLDYLWVDLSYHTLYNQDYDEPLRRAYAQRTIRSERR
jgi:hypothetical protein